MPSLVHLDGCAPDNPCLACIARDKLILAGLYTLDGRTAEAWIGEGPHDV